MSSKAETVRLHAIVKGRVQGVGFRAFTQQIAITNQLVGWVRNRWDGSVEVVAEGSREDLESFLKKLQRGPRAWTAETVNYDWQGATGEFSYFRVRMTA